MVVLGCLPEIGYEYHFSNPQIRCELFLDYPIYNVPVEVKRESIGFKYQQQKYGKNELSRAVVLCAFHNHRNIPRNIDVIELDALCSYDL